jgi:hypothetical protein
MSIPPQALRPLHTHTAVKAFIHPNDIRRRADVFTEARDGAVFNTLMFNTAVQNLVMPSFAHFTVIAGPCGFPEYFGSHLALPFGSPHIAPRLPDPLTNVSLRSHRVSLAPHVDLQIVTTILPGEVTATAAFTSP